MTKPSDFILNSDFLTIAQASVTEPFTIYFPAQTFPVISGLMHSFSVDRQINSAAVPGAVDRISIVYNGTRIVGNRIDKAPDPIFGEEIEYDQFWTLLIFRKDRNTLTARCTFYPPTSAQTVPSTPSLTFTISATSFRPPNVV